MNNSFDQDFKNLLNFNIEYLDYLIQTIKQINQSKVEKNNSENQDREFSMQFFSSNIYELYNKPCDQKKIRKNISAVFFLDDQIESNEMHKSRIKSWFELFEILIFFNNQKDKTLFLKFLYIKDNEIFQKTKNLILEKDLISDLKKQTQELDLLLKKNKNQQFHDQINNANQELKIATVNYLNELEKQIIQTILNSEKSIDFDFLDQEKQNKTNLQIQDLQENASCHIL